MASALLRWMVCLALFLATSCSSRPEGTCEHDSQCKGALVCFEKKCISVMQVRELRKVREEAARPKVCEDKDGDGAKVGEGCPPGTPKDCNDNDPNMAPGKDELCDAIDNNCDGRINEGQRGCVQTVFGGASWGNQAEHRLLNPHGVLYDPQGFVLLADDHHIWKINPESGQVEVFAGSQVSNFENGAKDVARFSYPQGMARADNGDLYVADCKNNCIRRIAQNGVVSTLAGMCSNMSKDSGQIADGPKDVARFYCPTDVAVAPDGSVVVVDRENARIRRVTQDGTVTTIAGVGPVEVEEGKGQIGFQDGKALEARFNDPQSVLVDPRGIIFVAESFNCRIRRIDPKKGGQGEVSTFVGDSDTLLGVGGFADGAGKKVRFNFPHGMTYDRSGNMIVADLGNNVIRLVTPAGSVRTLYGKAGDGKVSLDGPIAQARFQTPSDVAVGPNGTLFVVDAVANRLRWIVP